MQTATDGPIAVARCLLTRTADLLVGSCDNRLATRACRNYQQHQVGRAQHQTVAVLPHTERLVRLGESFILSFRGLRRYLAHDCPFPAAGFVYVIWPAHPLFVRES